MAMIGYARISTGEQTLDLQRDALHAAGCLDIYEEQASGARVARPVLAAALRTCREGDLLVVWKLDRLGRNTTHLLEIVEDLTRRGVALKTLTGYAIDTSTPHGKLVLHMFAALAEYERALIQERIMAGIAAARARGRTGGRRPKLSREERQVAVDMARGGSPVTRIAKTLGCSRHTVYKALGAQAELAEAADEAHSAAEQDPSGLSQPILTGFPRSAARPQGPLRRALSKKGDLRAPVRHVSSLAPAHHPQRPEPSAL